MLSAVSCVLIVGADSGEVVQYGFTLTKNGEQKEADEALRHLTSASVIKQSPARSQTLRLALIGERGISHGVADRDLTICL
jgi:hypothetical protein